jgi:DNA ligase-1
MPLERLYKKDSQDRIRIWEIQVNGPLEDGSWQYFTMSGLEDGGIITNTPHTISAGKQNRTVAEQAQAEAQSKWMKKLDEGYKLTRAAATTDLVVLPMLAKSYAKAARHVEYPAAGQRKFDGVRCLAMEATGFPYNIALLTRKSKEFAGLNNLRREISLLNLPPSIVLDGELFSDTLTFQRVTGLVRKHPENLTEQDLADLDMVQYRIYDLINLSGMDMPFVGRYRLLQSLLNAVPAEDRPRLRITRNVRLDNEEDVIRWLGVFEREGQEGLMVRNLESPYELDKRSKHLQKVKTFIDDEFPIVGYYEAAGNDAGTPIWECEAPNGRTFRARPMGTLAERRELWANRDAMIGRPLTVRFFEYTDDGVPRFPIGVTIRDYEGEEFEANWMGMNLAGGVDEIPDMIKGKVDEKDAEAPLKDIATGAELEIKIYVPSTQGDEPISSSEFEERVRLVQTFLSTLYGGYTTVSADGGYVGEKNALISEPVQVVSTWADTENYEDNLDALEEFLMVIREGWSQETIGYEFENDFFMYPDPDLRESLNQTFEEQFATEDNSITTRYEVKYQETANSPDGEIFTATSDLDVALEEAQKLLAINMYRVEVYRITRFTTMHNVLLNTDLIFAAKYDYWTTNTPSDAPVVESISRRFPERRRM